MNLQNTLNKYIDGQYRRPTGIVGRMIAERMVKQHAPENIWSVSLLEVKPEDHILEIGFGPGKAIELLAAQATRGQVSGIDYSGTMVKLAHKRNRQAVKAGRVKLQRGDVIQLPFPDQSFTKVLGIHTLYFWQDPSRALQEIMRVLKVGGTLTLTILPLERWPGGWTGNELCRVYSGEDVIQHMRQAGFAAAHIERGPTPEQFREIAVVGRK